MFIYKITNTKNNKSYIGFDSHPEHLSHRWNIHKKECNNTHTKFYVALRNNISLFNYEIIDKADRILDLALKEIYWIDFYDSYKNGYNSTRGGDGLNYDLTQFTEEEIGQLKRVYSLTMSDYNNNTKWKDKTVEERKELTKHLHTDNIYKKKSETLSKFYKSNPEFITQKSNIISEYWANMSNDERVNRSEHNRINSLKGAEKVSKKVKVELPNGDIKIYNSKSEFNRENGEIINAILRKTKENKMHRGFKGWEL